MSKQKSKRGWCKRVKVKKSGVVSRRKCGKRHLLSSKSRRRKRRLLGSVVVKGPGKKLLKRY